MKPKILLSFIFILNLIAGISQTHPAGINYQAVARNTQGVELSNTTLAVKFSIMMNDPNAIPEWQEVHNTQTNQYGLFTLTIGQGNRTSGTVTKFDSIHWGIGTHYLKIEVDFGTGYLPIGTTQMTAVPYALYADRAGNSNPTGVTSITYDPSTYSLSADGKVVADLSNIKTAALQDISINSSTNMLSLSKSGNTIDLSKYIDKLTISGNTLGILGSNSLTLPRSYFSITEGKLNLMQENTIYSTVPIDTSSVNEIQHLSYDGKNITLDKSGGSIYDADTSKTNELITSTGFDGTNLHITEAGTDHPVDLSSLKKVPWVGFSTNVNSFSYNTDEIKEIIFSEEFYDNTNSFNSTSFKAPGSGVYSFNLNLFFQQGLFFITILKNGANFKAYPRYGLGTFSVSFMMDLSAGDAITILVKNDSGYPATLLTGSFTGYQLH